MCQQHLSYSDQNSPPFKPRDRVYLKSTRDRFERGVYCVIKLIWSNNEHTWLVDHTRSSGRVCSMRPAYDFEFAKPGPCTCQENKAQQAESPQQLWDRMQQEGKEFQAIFPIDALAKFFERDSSGSMHIQPKGPTGPFNVGDWVWLPNSCSSVIDVTVPHKIVAINSFFHSALFDTNQGQITVPEEDLRLTVAPKTSPSKPKIMQNEFAEYFCTRLDSIASAHRRALDSNTAKAQEKAGPWTLSWAVANPTRQTPEDLGKVQTLYVAECARRRDVLMADLVQAQNRAKDGVIAQIACGPNHTSLIAAVDTLSSFSTTLMPVTIPEITLP